jgi:hypothetical protein
LIKALDQVVASKLKKRKSRILTFREFCQHLYDPSKLKKTNDATEEERRTREEIEVDHAPPN